MSACVTQKVQLSDLGEFGLINGIKKRIGKSSSVVCGIGDDAAVVLVSSGKYLLLTTDMLVEGVHFTKKMPARAIGHKAIAASISDIAAMGGTAKYAVVSLGVPASCSGQFVFALYQGIKKTAKDFHISVVGGDMVHCHKVIINVALTGEVKRGEVVYRNGARRGDQIFVTGPLGRSLPSGWHLRFIPRTDQANYLIQKCRPTSMIDISDGLAADLGHILHESCAGAVLEEKLLPYRRGARLKNVLYDGEDFELLFTLSAIGARKLQNAAKGKFRFYRIGEIVERRKGLQIKTVKGMLKNISMNGYTHF